MDPSDQITGKSNGSSVPGVSTLTLVTPLTHLYPPDPPYRPKHAPKRNPMANPDPTESSHTPRGSIAPTGHQGGALGHGSGVPNLNGHTTIGIAVVPVASTRRSGEAKLQRPAHRPQPLSIG